MHEPLKNRTYLGKKNCFLLFWAPILSRSKAVTNMKNSLYQGREGDKYYIGYKDSEFVRPLCIILSQMSGYIKYFDGNRESMSFFSKDEISKYNKIWKTTKTYGFKLDSESVYDKKYVKN